MIFLGRVWFFTLMTALVCSAPVLGATQDPVDDSKCLVEVGQTADNLVVAADDGLKYVVRPPIIVTNWALRRFDFFLNLTPVMRGELETLGQDAVQVPSPRITGYKVTFHAIDPQYRDVVMVLKPGTAWVKVLPYPYYRVTVQMFLLNLCGPTYYSEPATHFYTTKRGTMIGEKE